MTRPDLFDYIGMVLAIFIIALWVAHFALPSPPPDISRTVNPMPPVLPTPLAGH